MKKFLKIVKICSVLVITIILTLVILAAILEPQITQLFLQKANRSLNSKVEVKGINFSLLKSFPQASIELADIIILSPTDLSGGHQTPNDTLLSAGRLYISLKIPALLKKQYIIDRLSIENGELFIREDIDGKTNLGIVKKGNKNDTSMVSIELRNIRIDNTRLKINSRSRGIKADLFIIRAENRLSLSPSRSQIDISANLSINQFEKGEFKLDSLPGKISIITQMGIDAEQIYSEKTLIGLLGSELDLNYNYNRKDLTVDASFNISPTDVEPIIKLFNTNHLSSSIINGIAGVVTASGTVSGQIASGELPVVKGLINIEKGKVAVPGKNINLSSITATGSLIIDPDDLAGTFLLNLPSIAATYENSDITGSLLFNNLKKPDVDMIISGDIDLSDFSKFYINSKTRTTGIVRTNIRLNGQLPSLEKIQISDILRLNRSVSLNFRSATIDLPQYGIKAEKIKGNIMASDNIWVDGITFSIDGSVMAINGMVSGFNKWLIAPESPITLSAGLWSNRIDSKNISAIVSRFKSDSTSHEKRELFSNLSVNLDLKLDSLIIKDFNSSMVSCEISYSNNFVNISSFSLQALSGGVDGNAAIARLSTGGFVTKGWFDIDRINIRETFSVFNNFGQNHITSDNLNGMLTGSINITTELNQHFKPDLNRLTLSGTYSITDGELLDFEPVMKLSKFVELSELKDISFSELRNNLIIENRSISIPSMEIKSTAFDLSLSGNHSFDGNYTYHLKLLLSDLLSKKASESNSNISEFGTIEDDGLGKTSLYLRIDGSKNGSKVSYDIKNLKVDIKKSVVEEKVTLKSILKEEYGWYKGDSLPPKQKEEPKKFRIIWEEADSINIVTPPSEEKLLPLKSIFRKKKGGENTNM